MIAPAIFRMVLGNYPTGVCAITATGADDAPLAMIVGSFTSVSLDPPLIGFFPDKSSRSWPMIANAGRFCVNILAAGQRETCRQFASSGNDKFAGVEFSVSGNGSPLLAGSIAWIDCDLEQVSEAGDHYFVLGRVLALDVLSEDDPLLFFKGSYGGFATHEHMLHD
jgi:3-hydroxy-9,10-secoandrosta-1,3,5(10)-triene-9,17-dione monooxygenase reductase component